MLLMSDLTHRSLACKALLNMIIENALYKIITITNTITILLLKCQLCVVMQKTFPRFFSTFNFDQVAKIYRDFWEEHLKK